MKISVDSNVGEIVRDNFKTAQIFENNNIDFCCGGNKSLKDACSKVNIDVNDLISKLIKTLEIEDSDSKYFENLALDALCNYIIDRHHSYVSENIPFIQQKLQKLCEVHGNNHSELFEIKELFDGAAGQLSMHMEKEELVLFLYIKKMVKSKSENKKLQLADFGSVKSTIDEMLGEHQTEGDRFAKISGLSNNFSTPPDGCNTYEVTYRALQEFERDLHKHIHLENNILFHKAVELEKELTNR